MAPRRKCTPEQFHFLLSYFDQYSQIPKNNVARFEVFKKMVQGDFFAKFPEREFLISEGILPPADAVIQLSQDEDEAICGAAIKRRKNVSPMLILREPVFDSS